MANYDGYCAPIDEEYDPCDDGDPCTAYYCTFNQYYGPAECHPISCDDENECTDDCRQASGCTHTPVEGRPCDDEDPCTDDDQCTAGGVCVGTGPCDDGDPCTTFECTAAGCILIDDTCVDQNECTDDVCDPDGVCMHIPVEGRACDDNNPCTAPDGCTASGACYGAYACDDELPCTLDSCDSQAGCINTSTCTDGKECTVDECTNEGCIYIPDESACDDGDECTADDCDEWAGDRETGCRHFTIGCTDGIPCTDDSCDPAIGCKYTDRCGTPNDRLKIQEVPSADDQIFIGYPVDSSASDVRVPLNITRFAGATNFDGTLKWATSLVKRGRADGLAWLEIRSFDAGCPNQLTVNGTPVGWLGGGCTWETHFFAVPLAVLKFPAAPGTTDPVVSGPIPATNDIALQYADVDPCRRIAWAKLTIGVMSPIILVHGNSQNGEWWTHHGFPQYLQDEHLVVDYALNLGVPLKGRGRVEDDALELSKYLPEAATRYGVNSMHIVAHSKGGLDIREYLASPFYLDADTPFEILSVTTLSTPHDGAVGADILEMHRGVKREGIDVDYSAFPQTQVALTWLLSRARNDAHIDLTTYSAVGFNSWNVAALPRGRRFNRVGGDADLNFTTSIDATLEWQAMTKDDSSLWWLSWIPSVASRSVDQAYQQAGRTLSIPLVLLPSGIYVALPVQVQGFMQNDTAVTLLSASGSLGGFGSFASNETQGKWLPFRGNRSPLNGRNHSNVADGKVAQQILPWIVERERSHGDLH